MKYDVIIIGAGPAGYVAAIRAAQTGLKTALIEKNHLGGMCLNWGCIPTKAIIESAKMYRKVLTAADFGVEGVEPDKISFNWDKSKKRAQKIAMRLKAGIGFLMKKNGIEVITGEAVIKSENTVTVDNRTIESSYIIIATGSYPAPATFVSNSDKVIQLDKLFEEKELAQHIVVYGRGAVAVEMTQFFNMIGKNVTLISPNQNIIPRVDTFLSDFALKTLKNRKVNLIISDKDATWDNGILTIDNQNITCDTIINCSMRRAVLIKSEIAIKLNENGFIDTDDNFETNVKGIYAVGDVNGKSYLAHIASAQGLSVVNSIKGIKTDFNFDNFPINIYTSPEMSQIGKTEQALKEEGIDYKISQFPLSANGKAQTEGQSEGLIRLLSDNKYGQVLGVQIIADHATDMIAEAAAYMQIEGTVYDVASTMHAHPTVSEIFMEAGFEAIDKAIHQ